MVSLEKARLDPGSAFKNPHAIVDDKSISRDDKVDLLRRWAYDAREIAVAEEENMMGSSDDRHHILLEDIQRCLLELGIKSDELKTPPTKQG